MRKTTDTFGKLKFWVPQNQPFEATTCTAGRASKRVIDASFRCHAYGDF